MIEKKNILYISYDGMTDSLGQSQVIPYLVGLTKLGYSFTVLSCEKPEVFERNSRQIKQVMADAGLTWHPVFYTKRPPVLSTLYDYYKLTSEAVKLNNKMQFKAIHCRSYIAALVGQRMKKKYSIPFIFDMRGFWADERVDGGLWNLKNPLFKSIYWFFKNKEKQFYKQSAKVVTLTNASKKYIVESEHIAEDKIGVIPTCVNFQLFRICNPTENADLKNSLGIAPSVKVFLYAGALGGTYNTGIIFEAYVHYKKYFKNTHLLLLAKDPFDKKNLKTLEKNKINEQEVSLVHAKFADVCKYLNIGDMGFVFYEKAWSNIARSPTKLGEYLACGLPSMVYGSIGDLDQIQHGLALFITPVITEEDCFDVFNKIEKMNLSIEETRRQAYNYYNLQKGVEFYSGIYSSI